MKKQTSGVCSQPPSSSGGEVTSIALTWSCRRNRACCMQGPIQALRRNLQQVLPVRNTGIGAPTTTALGHNFNFLMLSLWQNSAFSWFMSSLVTKTNQIPPPTVIPDYLVKAGFLGEVLLKSSRYFSQESFTKKSCAKSKCRRSQVTHEPAEPLEALVGISCRQEDGWRFVSDCTGDQALKPDLIYDLIALIISGNLTPQDCVSEIRLLKRLYRLPNGVGTQQWEFATPKPTFQLYSIWMCLSLILSLMCYALLLQLS